MKTVTWHYGGLIHAGSHDVRQRRGGATSHLTDKRYKPVELRLALGSAPIDGQVIIDINDDGASILDLKPQVADGTTTRTWSTFGEKGATRIEKGSVLTLDIDETAGGASALTVELDLEEV